MRLIIIGVVVLLLLGGGGAGAYFYFFKPPEIATEEGAENEVVAESEHGASDQAAAEGDHESGEGDHAKSSVEYVELDPLLLPIIDNEGVSQTLSMVITIQVSGVLAADKVKNLRPVLQDAFIQDMYGVLNEFAALKGGVIQVGLIKKRLNKITKNILGPDFEHDVLLQVVEQRPL